MANDIGIRIEVDTGNSIRRINAVTAAVNNLLTSLGVLSTATRNAASGLRSIEAVNADRSLLRIASANVEASTTAATLTNRYASLVSTLRGLAAAIPQATIGLALGQATVTAVRYSDSLTGLRNRLLVVFRDQRLANQEFRIFTEILDRYGFSIREALPQLTNFASASFSAGSSLSQINRQAEGLITTARNLNLTTESLTELTDVISRLQSGNTFTLQLQQRLLGLGFNPGNIAAGLGLSLPEFERRRQAGNISGRAVAQSVLSQASQPEGTQRRLGQTVNRVINAFGRLADVIGTVLTPFLIVFGEILQVLINAIVEVATFIGNTLNSVFQRITAGLTEFLINILELVPQRFRSQGFQNFIDSAREFRSARLDSTAESLEAIRLQLGGAPRDTTPMMMARGTEILSAEQLADIRMSVVSDGINQLSAITATLTTNFLGLTNTAIDFRGALTSVIRTLVQSFGTAIGQGLADRFIGTAFNKLLDGAAANK